MCGIIKRHQNHPPLSHFVVLCGPKLLVHIPAWSYCTFSLSLYALFHMTCPHRLSLGVEARTGVASAVEARSWIHASNSSSDVRDAAAVRDTKITTSKTLSLPPVGGKGGQSECGETRTCSSKGHCVSGTSRGSRLICSHLFFSFFLVGLSHWFGMRIQPGTFMLHMDADWPRSAGPSKATEK